MAGGSMMAQIVMRKCCVPYKNAKQIVQQALQNLDQADNKQILWSKELQAECFRLAAQEKEKEDKEKEATRKALHEVEVKHVPFPSREKQPTNETKPAPLLSPLERRPTIQRQRSKSLTQPRRTSLYKTASSDKEHISNHRLRSKSETRSTTKKAKSSTPTIHKRPTAEEGGDTAVEGRHRRSRSPTKKPVNHHGASTASAAPDAPSGIIALNDHSVPLLRTSQTGSCNNFMQLQVLGASKAAAGPLCGDSTPTRDHGQKKSKNAPLCGSSTHSSTSPHRSSTICVGKKKQQQVPEDGEGAFVVVRRPSKSADGNEDPAQHFSQAIRRKSIGSRSRSRSRSRSIDLRRGSVGSRVGELGGRESERTEDENDDLRLLRQTIMAMSEADVTPQSSRRVSMKQAQRRQSTGPSVSASEEEDNNDPLKSSSTHERTQKNHGRQSFSHISPTKNSKPKATKPTSSLLSLDAEDDQSLGMNQAPAAVVGELSSDLSSPRKATRTKSSTLTRCLHELEDNGATMEASLRSLKSPNSATKQRMVPVLRKVRPKSPARKRELSNSDVGTNTPSRSSSSSHKKRPVVIMTGNTPIRSRSKGSMRKMGVIGMPSESTRKSCLDISTRTKTPTASSLRKPKHSGCGETMSKSSVKTLPSLGFQNGDDEKNDISGSPSFMDVDNQLSTSRTSRTCELSTDNSSNFSFRNARELFEQMAGHSSSSSNSGRINSARSLSRLTRAAPQRRPSVISKPLRKHGVTRDGSLDSLSSCGSAASSHSGKSVKVKRRAKITKDRSSRKLAQKALTCRVSKEDWQ